ncbi:MarR family winged helix-turn-helix transcriptional regulator [Wenzhouxiangella limi]|uniref:MarR family transcriptional regulator n=1 Tax=Wenzhouxiangella limi TaxID=2707351 RepID=A0A845V697_9GAMM|nr:MarR family transcriptional regulator [Wenzhouxiangella limi]NDY96696.1 MarR family transcriptional regulator [Wenzhouxiangella limi]
MTAPPLKLEEFLPYRLSVLSNQVSQGIARTYSERFGLSVTEWRVIAILGRFPAIPASQIVERSAMDKVAISRAVRRLLEAGLVLRQSDHSDRRAKPLSLSDEGQAVHAAIAPAALDYEQKLLAALTPDERRMLNTLLDKLDAVSRAEP